MNSLLDQVPLAAGALILFSSILCAQAPAQGTRKPGDPAVEQLLTKIMTQRGATKPSSLVVEGSYSVSAGDEPKPIAKGRFVDLFSGTELARETCSMGKDGAMERGVHDGVVWEVDPYMGAKVQRGAHADVGRRYFALLRGDDPRDVYRQITIAGTESLDGREHTVLQLTPAEGKPVKWFVDADGNVARVDVALPVPESADATWGVDDSMDSKITFADWRQVDGVRFPFRREMKMGPMTVSYTVEKIEVGAKIDPARFVPPPAVAKVQLDATGPAFDADGKPTYQIVERQAQPVASIRMKIKPSAIKESLGTMLPEVMAHLTATGGTPVGPPFSRYHSWNDQEIDIEAGFPVKKAITEKGRIKNSELPGGKIVTCWHVGPYELLSQAHEGLRAHLDAKKLTPRGGCWEIYWTDPGMVPDPKKWKTQLFAPIECPVV